MASQAEIEDEILARRLQSEEFVNQSNPNNASSSQTISDEEFARRLQLEEQRAAARMSAIPAATAGPPGSQFALRAGQSTPVRLHHPITNRQIGEVVLANHISVDEMTFELSNAPGKYLKVRETGGVEFDYGQDITSIFKVENANTRGSLHFMCKAFMSAVNRNGGSGWYISMTMNGQLLGNGGRNQESEWVLVAANTPVVTPRPAPLVAQNSLTRTPSYSSSNGVVGTAAVVNPITPMPQVVTANTPSPALAQAQKFPGFAAGREELMRFFVTPAGQAFLQQPDYAAAFALYRNKASLANILHRPDWPILATRYQEFLSFMTAMNQPGASAAAVAASSGMAVDLLDLGTDSGAMSIFSSPGLEHAAFRHFFAQGYTILPNVISKQLVAAAMKITNFWQFKYATTPFGAATTAASPTPAATPQGIRKGLHYTMEYHGDITKDIDILSLYYRSSLPQIVEKLIGQGDVLHPKQAQLVSIYPCIEILTNPPALQVDKWNIEGFTAQGGHSPFNILIGVALTDMSDIDMGNFCVHPESHYVLLEQYRRQVQEKKVLFSTNPYEFKKPDLSVPTQLKLRAGDVFLCTQRLAYLFGTNTSFNPSTLVFFRVSNIDHDLLKDPALDSLWLEYKHASKYMDAAMEERSILAVHAVSAQPEEYGVVTSTMARPASATYSAPAPAAPAPAPVLGPITAIPPPPNSHSAASVTSPRPASSLYPPLGDTSIELFSVTHAGAPSQPQPQPQPARTNDDDDEACLLGGSYENVHHSTATIGRVSSNPNPIYRNPYVVHDPKGESVGLLNCVRDDDDGL